MELRFVTFNSDQEQFLVDVSEAVSDNDANALAVKAAIRANKKIGDFNEPEWNAEMEDESLYSIEDVDFSMLYEIILRDDVLFLDEDVIVFRD